MAANKKTKKKLPKTMQQSIPYTQVYENGVIETEPGTFTKSYLLEDINFAIAQESEQKRIFYAYENFMNSFPASVRFQIVLHNKKADKRGILEKIRLQPARDHLNSHRSEMNAILMKKIAEAKSSLSQDKYLVVSIQDTSVAHAMATLDSLDVEIAKHMTEISKDLAIKPQTTEERLRVLHEIYNQDNDSKFENETHDGVERFSLRCLRKQGLTTKDWIGPSAFDFSSSTYMRVGTTYAKAMYVEGIPSELSTDYLADITSVTSRMLVSVTYSPIDPSKANRMLKDEITNVNSEIASAQKKANQAGYTYDLISPQLAEAQERTKELIRDVAKRDQRLFFATISVVVFGDTREEMEYNAKQVANISGGKLVPLNVLYLQQEFGLNQSLPLCIKALEVNRLLTTESGAVFLPYTSQELQQSNGVFYGINEITNSIITYRRMSGKNFNSLIFGGSGSGKSFAAKSEMISVLLRSPKNRVYVIDPEQEYAPIASAMHGTIVELSATSRTYLNPLDMDIDYDGTSDPIPMKVDYILGMIDIMLDGPYGLEPRTKSIVSRCVQNIYRPYLAHLDELRRSGANVSCDKAAAPTLKTLYNELRAQKEPEAQTVAGILEIYATGSMSTFAHRSNVETNNNLIVYDIHNLGTGLKPLGLYVALNDIWNAMIQSYKKEEDVCTYIYIDELHLLLQADAAASFVANIWARARKWQGFPCGITQTTEDMLRSQEARRIFNNTNFIQLLSLPKIDRENIGELLQLPESQLKYITDREPGHGLLYTGKSVIPFNNTYPKDSNLYKIMQTSRDKDKLERKQWN